MSVSLFIPELDGSTVSADEHYEAEWANYQLVESQADQDDEYHPFGTLIPVGGSGNIF
jgi:hypothetical protein